MGRRYRKRSRKKADSNPLPLLVAIPLAFIFYFSRDFFVDKNPVEYAFSFLFALIVISLLISFAIFAWKSYWKLKRQKALQLADIDKMHGIKFEYYVADLLRNQGFKRVKVTPGTNDFGIDITFSDENTTYAAQVKRNRGYVGVSALYQAAGGRDYYKKDRAVVISNSFYSAAAHEFASKTNILLIDRNQLADWINQFSKS